MTRIGKNCYQHAEVISDKYTMRNWIKLFEGIDQTRLVEIASDLLEINSDVIPERIIDSFTGSAEQCLAIIERSYHSADCDLFALVCQEITGDQPYTIRCGIAHHTVLSLSDEDGPFYDVTGYVTLAEIIRRYRFHAEHTEVIEDASGWYTDDDYTRGLARDAIRYLKMIGRDPFTNFSI